MVLPIPRRVVLWLLVVEVVATILVVWTFGNPRTSLSAAVALSLTIGALPAGGAAHAIRRRKPPFRFGLVATAIITAVVWAACAFALFIRTYRGY